MLSSIEILDTDTINDWRKNDKFYRELLHEGESEDGTREATANTMML